MKVDTDLVAAGLAEMERIIELEIGDRDGISAATLRLTIDCIAGIIKAQHPRFQVGHFQVASTPISNARLKQAILARLGEGSNSSA